MAVFAVRSLEHAAALGTAVDGALRLTINEEITQAEVDYLITAVRDAVAYLRSMSPVWWALQSGKTSQIIC